MLSPSARPFDLDFTLDVEEADFVVLQQQAHAGQRTFRRNFIGPKANSK